MTSAPSNLMMTFCAATLSNLMLTFWAATLAVPSLPRDTPDDLCAFVLDVDFLGFANEN